MRIAVYPSVLYGADWIVESIASIRPHVERVYVVMMQRPWGNTDGVRYKGAFIRWPSKFDDTRDRVAALKDPGVTMIEHQSRTPWNRWGHAVNDVVRKRCNPREVVILDPDCVFSEAEAKRTFAEWDAHPDWQWAQPHQVELWRTPAWQVVRPRSMVTLARGDLSLLSDDVRKARNVEPPTMHQLKGTVHNLGFCVSVQSMLWKHLTALAYSPVVGESLPNENWYDEKWLKWTPETRNLESSKGAEGTIPCAVPYDGPPLPELVQRRFA